MSPNSHAGRLQPRAKARPVIPAVVESVRSPHENGWLLRAYLKCSDSGLQRFPTLALRAPSSCPPHVYLVIGDSGFLGRHIVEALVARGDIVSVFDVVQRYHDVPFYSGDISEGEQVADALRKVRQPNQILVGP